MNILRFVLLILLFSIFSCSKNGDGIKPEVGTITESVYASGIIKAEDQYTVFSTVNGVLQKIYVEPGQSISKGQLLFGIESEKAQLNTENARLAYQLSQQNSRYIQDKIAEMELKVQTAKDKLAVDESIYLKNKNIKQYNIISEVDFERIELAYKNSKLNYESAQKQLVQLKIQLENDQKRNAINLKSSEKSESDFNVKSAFSGKLFDVLVKEGTLITPQNPLAVIGKENAFLMELEVDENDMVQIQIGQKAIVTMDSYPEKVFEAIIDKIYPIMDERSRTFKIEVHFVNPPEKLYPNLTVEGNIIIQTKKNALIIPRNYLLDNDYVLVDKDEKRKVKIGLGDYQKVEILEGLDKNEKIYMPKE